MAEIRRFEDFLAWQKARELAKEIYTSTRSGEFSRDYGLRDQIRRAVVSVVSNIAEGFECGSDREFSQFLVIAKASCAEVRAQLYVAFDVGYLTQNEFEKLSEQANEVSRLIGGLRASVLKRIAAQTRN